MPKVKKNGKFSKPKAKPKPERKDNTKSSTTKSKSVNQHQNVNVSVSIVKNKTGGSSKSGEAKPASNPPVAKPQPQNIYYQQPNNNNNAYNSELTTLLKDMNKELFAQRNIKAQNQTLINPNPNPIVGKPLIETQQIKQVVGLGNPKLPAYVGSNNAFEDEPFEEHFSDITSNSESINSSTFLKRADETSVTDSNNTKGTNLKIIEDTPTASLVSPYKDPSYLNKVLVATTPKTNLLNDQPNPFEGKRLIGDAAFGMPLRPSEIPPEDIEMRAIVPKSILRNKTALTNASKEELIREIIKLRITDVANMPYDEGYLKTLRKNNLKTILSQIL